MELYLENERKSCQAMAYLESAVCTYRQVA